MTPGQDDSPYRDPAEAEVIAFDEGPAEPEAMGLGEAVAVVNRHRVLVIACTILLGAIAWFWSSSQDEEYEATAQVLFRDLFSDLQIIAEGSGVPETSPPVRAAENAELVERPEVLRAASAKIEGEPTPEELEEALDTNVGSQTNFVDIVATGSSPEGAVEIANVVADQVVKLGTEEQLTHLDQVAEALDEQIKEGKKARKDDFLSPESAILEELQAQLSRVEALRVFADPVRIATRASAPDSPSSPDTTRNVVVGLLLGLAIGLTAAFARDALDRRLREPSEIQEAVGIPLLTRIPSGTLTSSSLVRGKAAIRDSDFEPIRALRVNLRQLGRDGSPPESVLVSGSASDAEARGVAAGLACAAAITGQKVLLIEADMRRPTLAKRMSLEPAPGLSDHLTGEAEPRDVLQVASLVAPLGSTGVRQADVGEAGTLACITAGSPLGSPPELLASNRFGLLMEKVSHAYDLVVVEAPPLDLVDAFEISPLVDAVIVCTPLAGATKDRIARLRETLDSLGAARAGLVVTRVEAPERKIGPISVPRGLGRS